MMQLNKVGTTLASKIIFHQSRYGASHIPVFNQVSWLYIWSERSVFLSLNMEVLGGNIVPEEIWEEATTGE